MAWSAGRRRCRALRMDTNTVLILHSPYLPGIGRDVLTSFYLEAHNTIRSITGFGEGHGPGSDRIIVDTHPYFAFDGAKNDAPVATGTEIVGSQPEAGDGVVAGGIWPKQACSAWGPALNTSRSAFGVTVAGEFSNGYNDCGLYLTESHLLQFIAPHKHGNVEECMVNFKPRRANASRVTQTPAGEGTRRGWIQP
ncbi:hypothetical protein B0H14DRAFT_3153087 [Mycena olivaceomarginata]|nr:hypothetical protein B0H14DRAFT_3153087 [Mycena olivaceomarginata]